MTFHQGDAADDPGSPLDSTARARALPEPLRADGAGAARSSDGERWADMRRLAWAGLGALVVRLVIVVTTPDVETDAYGHFKIARALLADPGNLHVHWVWLPGYHYALWALMHVGLTFTALRVLNALATCAAPFLLYDMIARRAGDAPGQSRRVASLAALCLTMAPLSNRLGTSAQAETAFALLVLITAWGLERRRAWVASVALTAACMLRYEAWGALGVIVAHCAVARGSRAVRPATLILPAAAIVGWVVLRRAADGEWLSFSRHTQAFASGVRASQGRPAWLDAALLPIVLPPVVVGPAIIVLPFGIRRAVRFGWIVPAGVLGFLVLSHVARGALGLDRYFTALMPFACAAVAEGALRPPDGRPRMPGWAVLLAVGLTTACHLGWSVHRARAQAGELRQYEADVSAGVPL